MFTSRVHAALLRSVLLTIVLLGLSAHAGEAGTIDDSTPVLPRAAAHSDVAAHAAASLGAAGAFPNGLAWHPPRAWRPLPLRPPAASHVTRLVLLHGPTRWDAWSGTEGSPTARGAAVDAAERRILRDLRALSGSITGLGGRVLSTYDTVLAGALVSVPVGSESALTRDPRVRRVARPPRAVPLLGRSGPAIGARRVVDELGVDGRGVTVAVADTGIDYTHASLGGPGDPAAFEAAARQARIISDTWQGRALFPNGRVVDGVDLAGERYAPSCSRAQEEAGRCTGSPEPDPDPLDVQGHGTHVVAIAAGSGTSVTDGDGEELAPGIAPGADIVAIKIFGAEGFTDLLTDALEWTLDRNLAVARGDHAGPAIDVLNLSLGIQYGIQLLDDERLIRRLVDADVVVVAAAGNAGDFPYIAGAPAVARDAIAVASHRPPGQLDWSLDLTIDGVTRTLPADMTRLAPWARLPKAPIEAQIVDVGRGCPGAPGRPPDEYEADPTGAIALFHLDWRSGIEGCDATDQVIRLAEAGAEAALLALDVGLGHASSWGSRPGAPLPTWILADTVADDIVAAQSDGHPVRGRLQPVPRPARDGTVSPFSSRGPSRTGALKPDLSAPGSGIRAAWKGSGDAGASLSGTSMSSPHVAGSAALVMGAIRSDRTPTAREIMARLVGASDPGRLHNSESDRRTPPVARTGAGAADAYRAATMDLVARAGPVAGISLGFRALTRTWTTTFPVTVTNHATEAVTIDIHPRLRDPQDGLRGLSLGSREVTIDGGDTVTSAVTAVLSAARLRPWELAGGASVSEAEALASSELDGWLELRPTTGATRTVQSRVPFYVLARKASHITAALRRDPGGAPGRIAAQNRAPFVGAAESFVWLADDPTDAALPGRVDLDAIGIRSFPDPDGSGNTIVQVLLHTRGTRSHPLETRSLVELDTDLDGTVDWRLFTEDEDLYRTGAVRNGKLRVILESATGAGLGPSQRYYAGVDLHARYTILPFRLEDTGLTPGRLRMALRAQETDIVEGDLLRDPQFDQVPSDGSWIEYDGRDRERLPAPESWTTLIEGGGSLNLPLRAGAETPATGRGMLVLMPDNPPGWLDLTRIPLGSGPTPVFLPRLLR